VKQLTRLIEVTRGDLKKEDRQKVETLCTRIPSSEYHSGMISLKTVLSGIDTVGICQSVLCVLALKLENCSLCLSFSCQMMVNHLFKCPNRWTTGWWCAEAFVVAPQVLDGRNHFGHGDMIQGVLVIYRGQRVLAVHRWTGNAVQVHPEHNFIQAKSLPTGFHVLQHNSGHTHSCCM
jgi:hypothetical protein